MAGGRCQARPACRLFVAWVVNFAQRGLHACMPACLHACVSTVLHKKKHEALVEITLPQGANIHARECQCCLPSKEELQQKLAEWTGM